MNQLEHLRNLYRAISDGATGDALAAFWHPDAEQIEYPSLMRPTGHQRGLAEMLDGAEVGRALLTEQRYDVHNAIAEGERVAAQITWTATLAIDAGDLPAGSRLVSHVAAFYEFRDGLILRQSSYDCYEPLPRRDEKDVA